MNPISTEGSTGVPAAGPAGGCRAFSVVIPTCNRPDVLALCLDPLAPSAQTPNPCPYEVIVSDDSSSDATRDMIGERYPWVKWSQGPRRGPAANRNSGAAQATGDWIVFVDDDCVPKPGWLAAYAAAIDDVHEVYEGKTVCEDLISSPLYEAPVNEKGGYLWSCNMMIGRRLFLELGGFDENFPYAAMEDVDLRERIRESGRSFPFVADAVVDHPIRRRRSGYRMGKLHESTVYHLFKHGKAPRLWRDFVTPITRGVLRISLKSKMRHHAPAGLAHGVVELSVVLFSYPGWVRKYRPGEGGMPLAKGELRSTNAASQGETDSQR